jgi:thiol-disulfide isomerase/thioredoxin
MKPKLWLLFLLLIFQSNTFGAPISIKGITSSKDAVVVRLYTQKDPISGLQQLLDQNRPDKQGKFVLTYNSDHINKVRLMIGFQPFDMFVEPGKEYALKIDGINVEEQSMFNPENEMQIVFEHEDMLNLVIDGFEIMYNDFLRNQFLYVMKTRNKEVYQTFEEKVIEKLSDTRLDNEEQQAFFNDYVHYRLSDIKLAARLEDHKKLGTEMIHQKNIVLNNPSYGDFFLKYFDKYLSNLKSSGQFVAIERLINTNMDTDKIEDLLGGNIVLKREQIRELVFINSLKQVYYNKNFSQTNIISILENYSKTSKYTLNRQIASNVIIALKNLEVGAPFPKFEFQNQSDEIRSLDSYQGKYVYLMFINSGCETCGADLRILIDLRKEYDEFLHIVTVFVSNFDSEWKALYNDLNPPWDILWFNDDYKLLNELKIKTFPKYFLIDSEGNLAHKFPPSPRENFISMINFLKIKQNENSEGTNDLFRKN